MQGRETMAGMYQRSCKRKSHKRSKKNYSGREKKQNYARDGVMESKMRNARRKKICKRSEPKKTQGKKTTKEKDKR